MTYEYPLFEKFFSKCPNAVYVGGTSRYLCRCDLPEECEGIKAAIAENPEYKPNEIGFRYKKKRE